MKSKAQILIEEINKICEERGLSKPKEIKREGSFIYIPSKEKQKELLEKKNKQ
ncbi:MAG: hypothetical protein IJI58_03115 [Bacilli bacterium]|nr:hypothetical protein [Bacilli bacterium]